MKKSIEIKNVDEILMLEQLNKIKGGNLSEIEVKLAFMYGCREDEVEEDSIVLDNERVESISYLSDNDKSFFN